MNRKTLGNPIGKPLLIIIFFATVATLQAQSAKEIIKNSRSVIFKDIQPEEVKGFYLKKAVTVAEKQNRFEMERELSVLFPSKLKLTSKVLLPSLEKSNFLTNEAIMNGEKVKVRTYYNLDGEIITQEQGVKDSALSKKEKRKLLKQIEANRKKQETAFSVQTNIWSDVYPLLLDFKWDKNRQLKYVGKALIGTKPAYILEFLPNEKERVEDKKNKKTSKTRLFLDEQDKLLVMILTEGSSQEGELKAKSLFSDYQEIDGLLVAKKINTEVIITKKDGSQQRTLQRLLVEDFKLNPKFKRNIFEVKKAQ